MRIAKRWAAKATVVGVVAAVAGLLPSAGHAQDTAVLRSIPGANAIVRGMDPAEAGCTTAADQFGKSGGPENPCGVRIYFNQPFTTYTALITDSSNNAVAGTWTPVDGQTTDNTDPTGCVSTNADATELDATYCQVFLAGSDTLVFTPAAPLADGDYTVETLTTSSTEPSTPTCDFGNKFGCYSFTFTVASTQQAPTLNVDSTSDHRDFSVTGTAEPTAKVVINERVGTDIKVIGTTAADLQGNFSTLAALDRGANTIFATATAVGRKTSEIVAETSTNPYTGGDASSTDSSITVTVPTDGQAPVVQDDTAPQQGPSGLLPGGIQIPLVNTSTITGTAEDNDQIDSIAVGLVQNHLGIAGVEGVDYTVTTTGTGTPLATWSVTILTPGDWLVSVSAVDDSTNSGQNTPFEQVVTTGTTI